jgi:mitochondrial fission protein ELM1
VSEDRPVSPDSPPRVWLLTGFRAGDKAQMVALAEALGWPFEIKRFAYKPYEFVTNILLGLKRAGVDWRRSDRLDPPWPDLVITAGRRNEPIARWIKEQSRGRSVIVHLGRPWSKVDGFDLVITTPQYNVPLLANVLQIDLPLHGVTAERLTAAATAWRDRIAALPRPWIAVMVGGSAPPYVFDERMASCLGREAAALARRQGGSLLVATSPRTSAAASDALEAALDVPRSFYRWTPNPAQNPYLGFLGLADQIIVTGDSMSMVAEAGATGKPVYFFDLGHGWTRMREIGPSPLEKSGTVPFRAKRLLHWLIAHGLPARIRRDIRNMLRPMVTSGRAAWLGDDHAPARPAASDDLARAAARVRQVFTQTRGS